MKFLPVLLLFAAMTAGAQAMTLEPDAPGAIYAAGSAVRITATGAQGKIRYLLRDYFGARAASGTAEAKGGTTGLTFGDLKPGWYELECKDDAGTATISVGILINRGRVPLAKTGRVCADTASSWQITNEALRKPFARIVRMAGIPWVRERLAWAHVETAPGSVDWTRYQSTFDTLAAEGIRVCLIWNPSSTDPGDVYRWAKTLARHFRGKIHAYEGWNEPEPVWPKTPGSLAALEKARSLGIRAGDPKAITLTPSLVSGSSVWAHWFCESGFGDYFEVFNWHDYDPVRKYVQNFDEYQGLLKDCGVAGRPFWKTETGICLPGSEGPNRILLGPNEREAQCRFVPRSVTMSLVAGNERFFWFLVPEWHAKNSNGATQCGTLRPDLTPYPSFVALSAAANVLGQADYVGQYQAPEGIEAYVFRTPRGNVIVAWSDKASELVIPTERSKVTVLNVFGAESSLPVVQGELRVPVGADAVYLVDTGEGPLARVTRQTRHPARPVKLPAPSKIVFDGYCGVPINPYPTWYAPGGKAKDGFDYTVVVYNFDEANASSGTVRLDVPRGWKSEPRERSVSLEAMGRQTLTFKLLPGPATTPPEKVFVRGSFGGHIPSPCVSYFKLEQ